MSLEYPLLIMFVEKKKKKTWLIRQYICLSMLILHVATASVEKCLIEWLMSTVSLEYLGQSIFKWLFGHYHWKKTFSTNSK